MKKNRIERVYWHCKKVFCWQQKPAGVYSFLLGTLREDNFKLADDLLYRSVDTLETTEDCFRFCTGTECVLVLCSELTKWEQRINLILFWWFSTLRNSAESSTSFVSPWYSRYTTYLPLAFFTHLALDYPKNRFIKNKIYYVLFY